uniref:Gnk2-homologous domain-containing protein n=1 Tax=Oryza brachyantha TaxID=4533 RepID=J3NC26_ORYBR
MTDNIYDASLDLLSTILSTTASSSPLLYARGVVGDIYRIFGFVECQGDVNATFGCPTKKDIIAKKVDLTPVISMEFGEVIGVYIRAMLSSTEKSPRKFINSEMEIDTNVEKYKFYGLAQCLADMSTIACHFCLSDLLPTEGSTGVIERSSSMYCSYRYQTYSFFSGDPLLKLPTISIKRKCKTPKSTTKIIKVTIDSNIDSEITIGEETEETIDSQVEHPSALASFEQITASAHEKTIALFLDYDGTLSPIVENPERALMSDEPSEKTFVTVTFLVKTEEQTPFQPASDFLPTISKAFRSLVEAVKAIDGATAENNIFCVCVHYRNVDKKVFKIRPKVAWNKGNAVEYLLNRLGLNSEDVLPIYLGDDITDEDAFKVLHQQQRGFGILVSQKVDGIKKTTEVYTLKEPDEIITFIFITIIFCTLQMVESGVLMPIVCELPKPDVIA